MTRFAIVFLMSILISCSTPVQEDRSVEPDPVREQFIKANRYMQRRHQDHIAAFVYRLGWDAEVTPSGLWIVREAEGEGPLIGEGDRVTYACSSNLLDGTPCYETSVSVPEKLVVGKGGVITGIDQGMRHLRKGSRAIFLIPPHLGHGNFGDMEKIPGNSVVIYRLEVLDVR